MFEIIHIVKEKNDLQTHIYTLFKISFKVNFNTAQHYMIKWI